MPLRVDEAMTLRTSPLKEADLIVSLFTREHGKVRGVARGARRLKNRFGAALEPMSRARVIYFEREGRELVTVDEADLVFTPHGRGAELEAVWTLQYLAEVVDQVAVEGDAQPLLYRLLVAVTEALTEGVEPALAARYFEMWFLKLQGVMPDLSGCARCGADPQGGAVLMGGERLACRSCAPPAGRRRGDSPLSPAAIGFLRDAERRRLCDYGEDAPPAAAVRQAGETLRRLLVRYLGREPRALSFLERLEVLP